MKHLLDQIVATYLTRTGRGRVFIVPHYPVPASRSFDDDACPDIVALDFARKEVVVIEVVHGSRLDRFLRRIRCRETHWFQPIRSKLADDGLLEQAGWKMRLLGFVRKNNLSFARKEFAEQNDVAFEAIEDIIGQTKLDPSAGGTQH